MTALLSLPFDELPAGARFVTRGHTVTEADVVAFAGLTGDRHPQHVDAEWAAGSLFGERIAHGLLVLSLAAGLVPFDPERVVALRRVREAVFKRPVRLGDTVCVHGRLRELTEIDTATGLVAVGLEVRARERAVARAVVEVLWSRAARATGPTAVPDCDPAYGVPL